MHVIPPPSLPLLQGNQSHQKLLIHNATHGRTTTLSGVSTHHKCNPRQDHVPGTGLQHTLVPWSPQYAVAAPLSTLLSDLYCTSLTACHSCQVLS